VTLDQLTLLRFSFLLYCDVYPSEMASQARKNVDLMICPSGID